MAAVELAVELGTRHGMTSHQQIRRLAKCVLEFGSDFPDAYADAAKILTEPQTVAWLKRDRLEAWIPRGRVRRELLKNPAGAETKDFDWNSVAQDRAGSQ